MGGHRVNRIAHIHILLERLTTIDAATLSKLIEGNRAPEGLFFGRLSAVSTAAIAPIVILGWFCQKQLVQGLTFGAVK